jgi:hypothetical protein
MDMIMIMGFHGFSKDHQSWKQKTELQCCSCQCPSWVTVQNNNSSPMSGSLRASSSSSSSSSHSCESSSSSSSSCNSII